MDYPLKDALKTICGVNQWSYAVFWKIGCQNPKLLIWEDCYHQVMSSFPSDFKSENRRPTFEQLTNSWLSHEAYILVNKMRMANQVHLVGQGLVGRAAFTGNHEWIVSGSSNEVVYPPEVLSEVHLQFSAGMQTIAVIPVMSHGVIQLGSSMAMMENVRFIQDVKTLILQLLSSNTVRDEPFVEFGSPFNHMNSVSLDPYGNMENFSSNVAFDDGKWLPSTTAESDSSHALKTQVNNKAVPIAPDVLLKQLSSSYDLHSGSNHDQAVASDCCHNLQQSSGASSSVVVQSHIHTNDNQLFSASSGEDLLDALGIDFKNKILNGYICNSSKEMVNQTLGKPLDLTSFMDPDCNRMSESCMYSACGSDHLLDAVVSGVQSAATQSSSDNLSCRTTLTKGSISSVPNRSAFGKNNVEEKHVQTTSYSKSHVGSWVDQGPTVATANSKNFNVVGKPVRKKHKPGENPKPRPKDRQLIQDRLKELRQIIPNGAKCSIDALLEQTIKHMVFLQSVNKHADKLNQTVESKIIDQDGGLLLKDRFEGGATWAYEVGCQAKMCPIIVEDLLPPHQFLVEMVCEEQGLFLEIADVIRGMGLTILKGLIEKRNHKIWAHFAVEAKREMTRMEIFVSLVHLMEHNNVKNNNNNNIAANEGFDYNRLVHPSTFDPATSVLGN